MEIKIGNRKIGGANPVFVVAELSANHHQKYEEAVLLVKAAKEAGADAVKLQTYTPDTITLNSNKEWFRVGGENNPDNWKGKTLYQLYETAFTPWEWQPKLKKLADDLGIILFSSPFDETAVDFLEKMDVPCYKVASYEVNDCILLKKIAETGKPVIMSIGYASVEDIELALRTLRENGAKEIAILHCVTDYKSEADEARANLAVIKDAAERWGVVAGFSDNSGGIHVSVMAAHAGAAIIEKHLILERALGGPDADFSLEPGELKELVDILRGKKEYPFEEERYKKAIGAPHYGPMSELEKYNLRWRRSLFAAKNIKKGECFTSENVRSVRPAFGLHTKHFDEIIGRVAASDIEFGTPLNWGVIEKLEKMSFRKAAKNDSEMLLRWRNDPETRDNSLNTGIVRPEEHEAWLDKTLKNPNRILFVVEENGQAVGTMRADKLDAGDGYELSWTVAPEFRGRGIGKKMLLHAVGKFNNSNLKAVIKKENIASIKIAQAAGFKQESEENGIPVWMLYR